jgi:hypothetical protein
LLEGTAASKTKSLKKTLESKMKLLILTREVNNQIIESLYSSVPTHSGITVMPRSEMIFQRCRWNFQNRTHTFGEHFHFCDVASL